jgi:hypothetical protein
MFVIALTCEGQHMQIVLADESQFGWLAILEPSAFVGIILIGELLTGQ